jgi:hypothetical protein
MKMLEGTQLNSQLRRVEEGFAEVLTVFFRTYPELLCFSLTSRADLPEGVDVDDNDAQMYITDIGFTLAVSHEYQQEVGEALGSIVSDVVAERPEALEVLPGRTFARALQ